MKFYLSVFLLLSLTGCTTKSWRDASRESARIAPPASTNDNIVLIYYARAFAWRGYFGVHPWIAWKKKDQKEYTVAQIVSWDIRRRGTALRVEHDLPDRLWYDRPPELLFEARGEKAQKIIDQLKYLLEFYPYKDTYKIWPGPNSNTFISYLIRRIDEIDIELPPTAIGKDYLGGDVFTSNTASNTGLVFSLFGYFGLTLGLEEGVELNLLGLHLGFDLWTPALKLPILGRIGFKDKSG